MPILAIFLLFIPNIVIVATTVSILVTARRSAINALGKVFNGGELKYLWFLRQLFIA